MFLIIQLYRSLSLPKALCVLLVYTIAVCNMAQLSAQEGAWEYAPYRIQMWVSIDPTLPFNNEQTDRLLLQIQEQTELIYDSTARIDAKLTPRSLMSRVLHELDVFSIKEVLASEMVLVVAKNNPAGKDIRTFETVLEKADSILVTQSNAALMKREMQDYLSEDASWGKMAAKLTPTDTTSEELLAQIKSGQALIALIRKSELESLGRSARLVPTRFPWQMDSLLKSRDKIFAVSITRDLENILVHIREIDCLMRVVGPSVKLSVHSLEHLPRSIAYATQSAFAPMARVEEADLKNVKMRIRAGGLINSEDHPARIVTGDVLVPYIRRDDRNGMPTLLQNLPWSYIAVASGNDVDIEGAVYSGIRGALAGRKNKRTKKIGLKARPVADGTDLQLSVARQPNLVVAGAEVYRRSPGDEDLELVGRTDWRGVIRIGEQSHPTALYDPWKPATPEATPVASETKENAPATPQTKPAKAPKSPIKLNYPLYLYYIRNGNTLLAKLPLLTGLEQREVAELPDDRRRLEAEAFVKGIQGEVLDLVARRQILSARIKSRIESKNKAEADELLNDLRKEKSYDQMQEELDTLQRRILSSDRGPITAGTQLRIDKMFDDTRQMLQKYLQDKLLRDLEIAASKIGG